MESGTGRCLCGAVRYRYEGTPNWQCHCHCESCRRATSSPVTSFLAVDHARFSWTAEAPASYRSSAGATRLFCARCGSQMAYQSHERAHEIDLYAATLDDPAAFAPTFHAHWNEHLPWLHLADDLPRHRTPRRLTPLDDMTAILALIRSTFAFMDGRIDPPTSMHNLTEASIAEQARTGEVWVIDDAGVPAACVFLTPKPDHLYVGKLAVDDAFRGQGLARLLVEHAAGRAVELGLPRLELQVRVELTENQRAFARMGFEKIRETAHEGYDRTTSLTFSRPV